MTIYWSDRDKALAASRAVHKDLQLGMSGGAIPGAESIKWISGLFSLDWLGHGYFASAHPIIRDMRELLLHHKPPSGRPGLKGIPSDGPAYWELRE
jgi:hypothetical protein